jgi:hypothetical protein
MISSLLATAKVSEHQGSQQRSLERRFWLKDGFERSAEVEQQRENPT